MSKRTYAVFQPVSTGKYVADWLTDLGHPIVEVRYPEPYLPAHQATYDPRQFASTIVYEGNPTRTAEALQRLGVAGVIPGADSGVVDAERVAQEMGTSDNDPALILARSDKFLQYKALCSAGLDTIDQVRCEHLEEALTFARGRKRIRLKPLDSGGTDQQFDACADDSAAIERAFRAIQGQMNLYGRVNRAVLVQETIEDAEEYVVDLVACRGRRVVVNVARYLKATLNGRPSVYREVDILPFDGHRKLIDYAFASDEALGQRQGGSHGEFFWMPDGRIKLVEKGFRPPGILPELSPACTGRDMTAMMVDAFVSPERFFAAAAECPPSGRLSAHGKVVFLASERSGTLSETPSLDAIRRLSSFRSATLRIRPGEPVRPTVDVASMVGWVLLVHPDPEILERDRDRIRELEPGLLRIS